MGVVGEFNNNLKELEKLRILLFILVAIQY